MYNPITMVGTPSAISPIPRSEFAIISERIIGWFRANRRPLPWRGADPYCVWVSEIMLQQTQVATVIPYFERFIARFPTLEILAAAPEEDVLRAWAGLGYYSRARNLHRAAQQMVADHNGQLPAELSVLMTLPGIGRYTAGAIRSIAYGLPAPVVDTNVTRVLTRLLGLAGDPTAAAHRAEIWSAAEQLAHAESPGDINQGLMEIGALVCLPVEPACSSCPLLLHCAEGNGPDPTRLPAYPAARPSVKVVHAAAVIRDDAGKALIVKRPAHGLWQGLWEFPRVTCEIGEEPATAAQRAAREVTGLTVAVLQPIISLQHSVTHHRITLHAFEARMEPPTQQIRLPSAPEYRWAGAEEMDCFAFPAPQQRLRELAGLCFRAGLKSIPTRG